MEAFYRKIYLHSWQIIKNNWYLLFFGLFVSALGLTGDFKALSNLQNQDIVSSTLVDWINIFQTFASTNFTWDKLPDLLTLLGSFFILAIVLVLAISSQGALIHATAQSHKKNAKASLPSDLQIGVENFWSLLGLNFINKAIGFLLIVGVISPIIYLLSLTQSANVMNFIIAIIVFFIIVPLAVIISFVTRYGLSYVVIKKQSLTQSFFDAWSLFRVNWIISLENALGLLLATIIYTIILISALAFVITPFLIIGYLVVQLSVTSFWLVVVTGSFLTIILFIGAVSFFGAYYTIVWTELFISLTEKTQKHSKIHRLASRHMKYLVK